jgi:hypothetical protein
VYITLDGGGSWRRLRAGIPSVAVRDIQLQRRENDLVAATFGRGLYIIDDYSPLRTLAVTGDGVLAPARPTRVYVESPFERAGFGNGLFSGDNPPFGALLSYTLRDATPTGTRTVLVIKDAAGKTINEINGPGGAGLNRAVWNLRHAPDTTSARATAPRDTSEGAPQGRGGGRGGPPPPGPLVTPGTYTVQLARRTGAALTLIGAPQRLRVIPLNGR